MKKYKNIVVFINESTNSKHVLEHAIIMAMTFRTIITLVYVVNVAAVISRFYQVVNNGQDIREQVILKIEKQGSKVLNKFFEIIPSCIDVKGVIKIVFSDSVILSVVKKYNADFIIINDHDFGLSEKVFINNNSKYIAIDSSGTILIINKHVT